VITFRNEFGCENATDFDGFAPQAEKSRTASKITRLGLPQTPPEPDDTKAELPKRGLKMVE
jgi:hypothetical protein